MAKTIAYSSTYIAGNHQIIRNYPHTAQGLVIAAVTFRRELETGLISNAEVVFIDHDRKTRLDDQQLFTLISGEYFHNYGHAEKIIAGLGESVLDGDHRKKMNVVRAACEDLIANRYQLRVEGKMGSLSRDIEAVMSKVTITDRNCEIHICNQRGGYIGKMTILASAIGDYDVIVDYPVDFQNETGLFDRSFGLINAYTDGYE